MRSALLLLALFAGGAGCVNNDASLSILQMQAVTEASGCVATGAVAVERSRGTLDVSLSNGLQGYVGFPIVRNNQVSRMPSADSPELNSVQLIGANVSLSFPNAADGTNVPVADRKFFWASAGGRIDPGGAAPLQIEVVPIKVVNEMKMNLDAGASLVSVTAEIQPVGLETSDRIVGGPIFYPVDLCNGCLNQVTNGCAKVAATCIPGQDEALVCSATTTSVAQSPSN